MSGEVVPALALSVVTLLNSGVTGLADPDMCRPSESLFGPLPIAGSDNVFSESESLEDEIGGGLSLAGALGVSVSLLELGLEGLDHGLALLRGFKGLLGDNVLELEVLLHEETRSQQVGVVDVLDERLDAHLPVELLLSHPLGDLLGGALNAGNEGVAELSVLLALIDLLHDDGLLASASSCEQDDDSSLLHTTLYGPTRGEIPYVCRQT